MGGDVKVVAAMKPLLMDMGKNVVHCGPAGTGRLETRVGEFNIREGDRVFAAAQRHFSHEVSLPAVGSLLT